MRADRAYIAGLGTTGVLVASALLLLAVVSTLVAFRGWPGTDVAEDIGNLIVGESRRPVALQEGPARVALDAAPAAGAVAETPAAGTAAAAGTPAPRTAPAAPRTPTTSVPRTPPVVFRQAPRLQAAPSPQPPDRVRDQLPDLLPQTPVSAEVRRVTTGLGDTTQELTDGLGRTVGTLSPPLGAALIDTGRLLSDILRSLGQPRPR